MASPISSFLRQSPVPAASISLPATARLSSSATTAKTPRWPSTISTTPSAPLLPSWTATSTSAANASSTASRNQEDDGEAFLFEDGRVVWYRNEEIGVGLTGQFWVMFYKIPGV